MVVADELDVVDDSDRVLARASRNRVHDEYLIHRSAAFFVLDENDGVFVNQRNAMYQTYPGRWSIAFGGHVQAGESYERAIEREVEEQTGLQEHVFPITTFQKRTADERENVKVYGVRATDEVRLLPDEIEQGRFVSMAELNEMLGRFDFVPETPALLQILTEYTSRRV